MLKINTLYLKIKNRNNKIIQKFKKIKKKVLKNYSKFNYYSFKIFRNVQGSVNKLNNWLKKLF